MGVNKQFAGKFAEEDERIYEILKEKPHTVRAIVEKTGYESKTVSTRLLHLKGKGMVIKVGYAPYKEDKHVTALWGLK